MSPRRSYTGDPLDHTWQYFHERPAAGEDDDETVYATDPEPQGEERTEDVPLSDGGPEPGDDGDGRDGAVDGGSQATLDEFGPSDRGRSR